ncbi:MAG TPA: rRNA adenine dimethyltransferase family protein, partial [Actinomycetaceae bacterium]|nr:rRNA adenine dimethyltransferase family protein [Actinomycetaceae bacterium]
LAAALPATVAARMPQATSRLEVVTADAMRLAELPEVAQAAPTVLVANLPYNVAVPVVLTALEALPGLDRLFVMVQSEVADRLAAPPGSRTYGAPSAKVAWYGAARRRGTVGRQVFWPVPNVDSALVAITRRPPPATSAGRSDVFTVIDAAFAQRRKTLRAALAGWAGGTQQAERLLRAAGIDPALRGERLDVTDFARIAEQAGRQPSAPANIEVPR